MKRAFTPLPEEWAHRLRLQSSLSVIPTEMEKSASRRLEDYLALDENLPDCNAEIDPRERVERFKPHACSTLMRQVTSF